MSRVQPPGRLAGLGRRPFGANTPGCGQVRASFGIYASIENGELAKWLLNGVLVAAGTVPVVSVQVVARGVGDVRLTSFCRRQAKTAPFCLICSVVAALALLRPLTPSQVPYRLSKLWFSS